MSVTDSVATKFASTPGNGATEARRRLRLGEVLVKEGLVTDEQIETALAAQKQSKGKRLGEVLVDLRIVDEVTIVRTLAKRLDLSFVDINQIEIAEAALKELPSHVMRDHNVVPVASDQESITVAFGDPLSVDTQSTLSGLLARSGWLKWSPLPARSVVLWPGRRRLVKAKKNLKFSCSR